MPYDRWLHWCVTGRCRLRCAYCAGNARPDAPVSLIDVARLLATLDRAGGVFRVSFTGGGEPFLVPNLAEACQALTRKHCVSFTTSLVEDGIRDLLALVRPEKVLTIHASCHLKEFERRGLLERFVENFRLCREKGMEIYAQEVGYPPLMREAPVCKEMLARHGIELSFGNFVGSFGGRPYPQAYTDEELTAFGLSRAGGFRHFPGARGSVFRCNAGFNAVVARPGGEVKPCDGTEKVIGHVYERISFGKSMMVCPASRCICPLYAFDPALYERACRESRRGLGVADGGHRLARWVVGAGRRVGSGEGAELVR